MTPYGTTYLGRGEISKEPPVVIGPITDKLGNFHPIGWYSMIRVRKHWWQLWKPKTRVVLNTLKAAPRVFGNIPDNLAGDPGSIRRKL